MPPQRNDFSDGLPFHQDQLDIENNPHSTPVESSNGYNDENRHKEIFEQIENCLNFEFGDGTDSIGSQENRFSIATRDLIRWSFEIARGMDYLVGKKVIKIITIPVCFSNVKWHVIKRFYTETWLLAMSF